MSQKTAKKEEAPPAQEPKKEAPKPQKAEKPKAEKKKKEERGVHALYKIENDKAVRLHPTCERCGPGYFMADHQDRYTCGHCGFTRYKRT